MKKFVCGILILGLILCSGCSLIQQQSPESVLKNYFTAVKKQDADTVTKLTISDSSSSSSKSSSSSSSSDYVKQLCNKLDATLEENAKISGDTATIKTKITAPDMKKIMSNIITSAFSTAFKDALNSSSTSSEDYTSKMNKQLTDELSKKDVSLTTTEINVQLAKVDGQWKVKVTDNLADAISGGLYSYSKSVSNAFSSSKS